MSVSTSSSRDLTRFGGINWFKDGPNGEKNKTGKEMFQHFVNCIDVGVAKENLHKHMQKEFPSENWTPNAITLVLKIENLPYDPWDFPPQKDVEIDKIGDEI
ncbi:hypothetical protein GLAREA_03289 [Glarea lozoyensis ATCC 20868]|uniref:Uncharacterized protein n=1 Tax=Glarea lozoyensis (strain ATCC 20868 / MF5171) TaxID=1116229 RepID=S3CQI8_GLAL2|nr:uncharacterized protein GLAREA_03289 [Glarea lozoyensis ATCC 20868]EPE27374.1 hypothetical protein GLAREA_03289 [Glarea lozoyensis ATCC 20868]